MKEKLLAVLLALAGLNLNGQVSERLKGAMASGGDEYLPVKVLFESQSNILEERKVWQKSGIPVQHWPQLVNRSLIKVASASQARAKKLLAQAGDGELKSATSFYIVNMMVLEARPALIYELYTLPEVSYIDLADEEWELIEPTAAGEPEQITAVGTEPGLLAINAPPMWKLGYTGKGGIAYDYDTGVWPLS